MLMGSLASIEEVSFLVLRAKMTSLHLGLLGSPKLESMPPLPEIDWSVLDTPSLPPDLHTRGDVGCRDPFTKDPSYTVQDIPGMSAKDA